MRAVLIIIAILLMALALFLFTEAPERAEQIPSQSVEKNVTVTKKLPKPAEPKPREAPAPIKDASPAVAIPVDAAIIQDAAPDESGVYSLSLGTHRVQLKGESGAFLSAEVVIKTSSATVREHARRLRSKLVGMYFFLVSRRVDVSVLADDGIERLESDLLQRYSNTIRSGEIDAVELIDHEVEEPEADE